MASPVDLNGRLPIQVYTAPESNTASVFMTDLPMVALEPGADLSLVWGQMVHLHLFVSPKPGYTPIATSACSVTIRYIVIAGGEVGVYGGGGFLYPRTDPGDSVLRGSIRGASCRLVAKTAGFVDRMGASEFRADFEVPKDDAQARNLAARMGEILAQATAVPGPAVGP